MKNIINCTFALNKNVLFVAPSEENNHKDIFEDKHSKNI